MVRIDVEKYIDELRNFKTGVKEMDLYSLKEELNDLSKLSGVFDNFEKESMIIEKEVLNQIQDFSLLMKIRSLAFEIKSKSKINEKLHSLHFNVNILKNTITMNDYKMIKNALNIFLYNDDTKIGNVIKELNDFKAMLDEIKNHHSNLLPKGLDNKLKLENKYSKHIEQLHTIHKRQKNALISTIKLFLKLSKKYINNLQKFKNNN